MNANLTPPVQGEDLLSALPEDLRRCVEELRFYRKWGFPYTDHSTMFSKDHQGLCAITLPSCHPHPQSEGTVSGVVLRAFTVPELYEKAVKHIASIDAAHETRFGPFLKG